MYNPTEIANINFNSTSAWFPLLKRPSNFYFDDRKKERRVRGAYKIILQQMLMIYSELLIYLIK